MNNVGSAEDGFAMKSDDHIENLNQLNRVLMYDIVWYFIFCINGCVDRPKLFSKIPRYLWTEDVNWTYVTPSRTSKTSSERLMYDFLKLRPIFGGLYQVLQKWHSVMPCDITFVIYPFIGLQFIRKEIRVIYIRILGR